MQTDNEQLYVSFHHQANNIFFVMLENFETTVKDISRQTEEYKYQTVKDACVHTLKKNLSDCAARLMQENQQNQKGEELSQNLQQFINQYLHLFVQKTRAA